VITNAVIEATYEKLTFFSIQRATHYIQNKSPVNRPIQGSITAYFSVPKKGLGKRLS